MSLWCLGALFECCISCDKPFRPLFDAKTTKGRKAIFIAKGSVHAMAYCDHHKESTARVKAFLNAAE